MPRHDPYPTLCPDLLTRVRQLFPNASPGEIETIATQVIYKFDLGVLALMNDDAFAKAVKQRGSRKREKCTY